MLLTACGGGPSARTPKGIELGGFMALPKPFARNGEAPPLTYNSIGERDIVLGHISGLDAETSGKLSTAIAKTAAEQDILILSSAANRPMQVLQGVATTTPIPAGKRIDINWYLSRNDNYLSSNFNVKIEVATGAPRPLPAAYISALANMTADGLIHAIKASEPTTTIAEAAPTNAAEAPPRIFINAASGAPGDGTTALPAALSRMLSDAGVPLADNAETANFLISIDVERQDHGDGSETISIRWQVQTANGTEIGAIEQSSRISQGSLDGAWGGTAYDIALGAEEGLFEILHRAVK